jgi:hypothetical protein
MVLQEDQRGMVVVEVDIPALVILQRVLAVEMEDQE